MQLNWKRLPQIFTRIQLILHRASNPYIWFFATHSRHTTNAQTHQRLWNASSVGGKTWGAGRFATRNSTSADNVARARSCKPLINLICSRRRSMKWNMISRNLFGNDPILSVAFHTYAKCVSGSAPYTHKWTFASRLPTTMCAWNFSATVHRCEYKWRHSTCPCYFASIFNIFFSPFFFVCICKMLFGFQCKPNVPQRTTSICCARLCSVEWIVARRYAAVQKNR